MENIETSIKNAQDKDEIKNKIQIANIKAI